jgi:hypothetical protein
LVERVGRQHCGKKETVSKKEQNAWKEVENVEKVGRMVGRKINCLIGGRHCICMLVRRTGLPFKVMVSHFGTKEGVHTSACNFSS